MAADASTKPSDPAPSDPKTDAAKSASANATSTTTTTAKSADKKAGDIKAEAAANAEPGRPLAPPPKPGDDYFSSQLSLEPNPFEQSFGTGGQVETPGGTKLPSVAALTSPSSLLPGNGNTPFNWGGGSLRTGPLSPAMLSGPAGGDYFGDTSHTLRGGFTPNESSLRTGLTPGGSGSMFPAASPNSQALFAMANAGGATPGTLDFQRTALSAAAAKTRSREQAQSQQSQPPAAATTTATAAPTTQAPETGAAPVKTESKAASGSFDPHDNDAANGLFMLAQGAQQRNGSQSQFPVGGAQPGHAHPAPANATSNSPTTATNGAAPPAAGTANSGRGGSEGSNMSEENGPAKPAAKGKGKRGAAAAAAPPAAPASNGRRKADEPPAKQPATKKAKTAAVPPPPEEDEEEPYSDDDDDDKGDGSGKSKMTDEEKRKNFLERNRVAALKCRQRKKQWLQNLQNKVEIYSQENDALTAQISQLREEVVSLKTLLLAHKDCPITQQQGMQGGFMHGSMEPYNPQMNPYGMAAPMGNQPVMAGQGVQRRFS